MKTSIQAVLFFGLAFLTCAATSFDANADEKPGAVMDTSAAVNVNPLTGSTLAREADRRRLQDLKVQAEIEAELLKIDRAKAERTRLRSGEGRQGAAPVPAVTDSVPKTPSNQPAGRPLQAKQPAKGATSLKSMEAGPVVDAVPALPRLVGIVTEGANKQALVEFGGRTIALEEGRPQGGVHVTRIDVDSALVNGALLRLAPTANVIQPPPARESAAAGRFPAAAIQGIAAPQGLPIARTGGDPFRQGIPVPAGETGRF